MIPRDLLSAFPHRQFNTLPSLLDSWAALPNSNPNACMPMQGGSLYHFYDGLWYDPDRLCKTRIVIQCSCLMVPLHGYMNRHCEEPWCSYQTLEGRSPIGYHADLFNITSTFKHYDQSQQVLFSIFPHKKYETKQLVHSNQKLTRVGCLRRGLQASSENHLMEKVHLCINLS